MDIVKKFLSRKLLMAIVAVVLGVTGILKPESEAQVATIANTLVDVILMAAPVVYIVMQGIVDKKAAPSG